MPCVAWVCLVCLLLFKEEGSSPVSAITEMRDMGLYEVRGALVYVFFWIGTMLANFYMCGIMLVLRAVSSPRRHMCFRCMMFSLSGPCKLLFLLCFIASWTWPVVSEMLYLCVALLMDLFVLCV